MRNLYGIDVSKGHMDIYGIALNGKTIKKRIKNKLRPIEDFLTSLEPDALICAEFTGIYSDLLACCAHQLSIDIALVSGYTIKHSMGNQKGKSDEVDAQRIYEYASRFKDKLSLFEPDSIYLQELKELFKTRNQLVKQKRMTTTLLTNKAELMANSIAVQKTLQKVIDQLTENIMSLEEEMIQVIQASEMKKNYDLITSIKGVGPITALQLIITSGNFKKISSSRKLASYAGVCPFPNQSGNKTFKAKVHPRSDRKLKSTLFLAAVSVCRCNKEFRMYKDRKLADGKQYFLVMNNVANKLLRMIYAIVNSEMSYDFQHLPEDPRKLNFYQSEF